MKKYLVIQLARFGDLMQTNRLIKSLLAEQAEVHLCLDHSLSSLAPLIYPECILHSITAHASGLSESAACFSILTENRHEFSCLQSESFDRIYNLNFSGLNFRIGALFERDLVVGYSMENGQEHISLWPEMAMRWSKDRRLGINLVDFWGCYADAPVAGALVNPAASPQGGGIGVVLAGRESRRSLPVKILARIVATRHAQSDKPVYLLGSSTETNAARALSRELSGTLRGQLHDMTGKTNWGELVDIVQNLDVLLTPDTGTMHLAAHLGTPVEAFFLSSAWCFETGPYGEGHLVYQAITDCLPCLESQACPHNIKCRVPLDSDQMLRFITTGKAEHCPEGLIAYQTFFDSIGLNFKPTSNSDIDAERRLHFRNFISPHTKNTVETTENSHEFPLASRFYMEKDWIL